MGKAGSLVRSLIWLSVAESWVLGIGSWLVWGCVFKRTGYVALNVRMINESLTKCLLNDGLRPYSVFRSPSFVHRRPVNMNTPGRKIGVLQVGPETK